MNTQGAKAFLKGIFSESDGTPSCARILSTIFVFCGIIWITFVIIKEHKIPDNAAVIPATAGTLYGMNKLGNGIGGLLGLDKKKDDNDSGG